MNYAIVKFFTEFSHRPMSGGNIFRVTLKADRTAIVLEDCIYRNYEMRNGLVQVDPGTILFNAIGGGAAGWRKIEEGIWYPSHNTLEVAHEKVPIWFFLFSAESDTDVELLLELGAINQVINTYRRDS